MDLEKVREKLINLEDIIIQGLCQRARFKHNNAIYEHNSKKFLFSNNYEGTYFDFMFKPIENVHAIAGRYECFDERPFYKGLSQSVVKRDYNSKIPDDILKFSKKINFSPWIKISYLNFLKDLCSNGDDANYGDSVLCDIFNLQAISKRIHYGILVMEAKYQKSPEIYNELLSKDNDISISSELKNVNVELKVLERVREKSIKNGIKNPDVIVNFFKNIIIPMTIQVELDYIFSKSILSKKS